ncbi:hypothetical protein D3C73_1330350 [compost metagenome]
MLKNRLLQLPVYGCIISFCMQYTEPGFPASAAVIIQYQRNRSSYRSLRIQRNISGILSIRLKLRKVLIIKKRFIQLVPVLPAEVQELFLSNLIQFFYNQQTSPLSE